MFFPAGESDPVENVPRALAPFPRGKPSVDKGHFDIFKGGGSRNQLKILENEPDPPIAEKGPLADIEEAGLYPVEPNISGRGFFQEAEKVEEGGLTRPRSPFEGPMDPRRDFERHAGNRRHLFATDMEPHGHVHEPGFHPPFDRSSCPNFDPWGLMKLDFFSWAF